MTIRQQQSKFVRMVADLIIFVYDTLGYELTFGDAYATTGHKVNSYHYKRLAIDLNLFINGEYQTTTEAHAPVAIYWESLGGTAGYRFNDGNHYALGE